MVVQFFEFFCYIFLNFFARVEYERNSGLNFFFLPFSASLSPFSIEIKPELTFLIFWIFLLFWLEFYYPGRVWTEFGTKIFLSFPSYHIPFWLKIMLDRGFLIFWFFFYFFRNFLPRVEYERNSGLKFFSLILGLLQPFLHINNAGIKFFNFLNFFAIFFKIFLSRSSTNGIRD